MNLGTRFFAMLACLAATSVVMASTLVAVPNGTPTIDAAGDPSNTVINVTVTGQPYLLAPEIVVQQGSITEMPGHTTSFASEARVRVTKVSNPTLFAEFRFTEQGDFTGTLQLTPNSRIRVVRDNGLIGSLINPGDVLRLEFFESFQDGAADEPESVLNDLRFELSNPFPPASFTPFVPVSNREDSHIQLYAQQEVRWYQFQLFRALTADDLFEIDTRLTENFLGTPFRPNDTEIGLYDSSGNLIASNDDEDAEEDILTSYLRFGSGGPLLAAGTYYLAVGGFDTEFDPAFDVTSGSQSQGPIVMSYRYDPAGFDVIGLVHLDDYTGTVAGQLVNWEIRNLAGAVQESGTATLGPNGGFGFDTEFRGVGQLWMRGATWLGKLSTGSSFLNQVTKVFTLINGDVDGDNEIGGGDLSILSGAFLTAAGDQGFVPGADLDGDGEVGSSDLSILSQNFLLAGE